LLGVLQNDTAPMNVDKRPFFNLLQGPKAALAGQVVAEATIADARGLSGAVDSIHGRAPHCCVSHLITGIKVDPGNASQERR
jgi:hypothetical protein